MKKKKFERQQRERRQRDEQKRREFADNLKEVILIPIDNQGVQYIKEYSRECPNHAGSFTYSMKNNEMWGHPTDLAFCAVCCEYYKFDIKQ